MHLNFSNGVTISFHPLGGRELHFHLAFSPISHFKKKEKDICNGLHICNGTIQIGTTILGADTQCLHESLRTCYSKWVEDYIQTLLDNLPLGMKPHRLYSCVCVCYMCVLRSEKMACQSLTEDDQLYVCRGISKGGGNRPGDG